MYLIILLPCRQRLNGVCLSISILPRAFTEISGIALDYPPFFAYFEKLLSIPASFIDPKIVDLQNLNYGAWSVVVYQRTTVILTELVLGIVLQRYGNMILIPLDIFLIRAVRFIKGAVDPSIQRIISISLFLHPGFLIVDHIHFQYNGFMFGILLWSILMARNVSAITPLPSQHPA